MTPTEQPEALSSRVVHAINELQLEIDRLASEKARTERNRDMWKGQCERQAAQLAADRAVMREALEALRERYVGSLRDSAITKLQQALGEG